MNGGDSNVCYTSDAEQSNDDNLLSQHKDPKH